MIICLFFSSSKDFKILNVLSHMKKKIYILKPENILALLLKK